MLFRLRRAFHSQTYQKSTPWPPLLSYFLPSPTHTAHRLWTCHCARAGEWGLLGVSVTAVFSLSVYSAQTLFRLWHTDIEMKWCVGKSRLPL